VATEHHRANLTTADYSGLVERDRQRLARVLERREVGQQLAGVDVHRVASARLDDRDAKAHQRIAEIRGRADAVVQIVVLHHLV